ncbi:hypothetical protein A3K24_00010 [candidate division Kazan bacterium RIFCSPHIGHO2_01_FULL_44_14]|uniref:Uncharacterized protein n=1 Tax=candidate division Kazan bacterium RIFCSPLOWO2_01_FULL_45_19 TaxID=1798538 RepID=A0A1F4NP78_UNCK3|nr:hypothetical protein [uncultured bacterium]OGB73253.1 MAG: hypothetical protein A3K51_00010 [candidate division Kazan bacterium RIFCSPLOWO2_01_FULL_45_19]OGB77498.1 MAG: hypothetical protein A3K24_00010 [candidate division Kazan bacterium RIFCSPHIGHO2_01_FULL_44_14]
MTEILIIDYCDLVIVCLLILGSPAGELIITRGVFRYNKGAPPLETWRKKNFPEIIFANAETRGCD